MSADYSILIAASGWAAWGAKEIVSVLLKRIMSRTGLHSFIEGQSTLLCDTNSKNAGVFSVRFFPEMAKHAQFDDARRFRIEIDGQLFNDTDTQCVYKKPMIQTWGVEGLRCQHNNPSFAVFDGNEWRPSDPSSTITVPPHATTRIRFEIAVAYDFNSAMEEVSKMYYDTVALLKIETATGQQREYRICTSSFCGPRKVVWPPDRKYPIYNQYSLNTQGRRAGRRPQPAKPFRESAATENAT